jgi:hypothetical protein
MLGTVIHRGLRARTLPTLRLVGAEYNLLGGVRSDLQIREELHYLGAVVLRML